MSNSDDTKILAEDLIDYCNAIEAAAVKLRVQIEKMLGTVALDSTVALKLPFDATKIKWQERENEKGRFQFSEDYDSLDHKALLKFLNDHAGGCITSEGWFYWVYPSGSKIGRKLRKAKGGETP